PSFFCASRINSGSASTLLSANATRTFLIVERIVERFDLFAMRRFSFWRTRLMADFLLGTELFSQLSIWGGRPAHCRSGRGDFPLPARRSRRKGSGGVRSQESEARVRGTGRHPAQLPPSSFTRHNASLHR